MMLSTTFRSKKAILWLLISVSLSGCIAKRTRMTNAVTGRDGRPTAKHQGPSALRLTSEYLGSDSNAAFDPQGTGWGCMGDCGTQNCEQQ